MLHISLVRIRADILSDDLLPTLFTSDHIGSGDIQIPECGEIFSPSSESMK